MCRKTYTGYITSLTETQVFVFGSNLLGFHGGGSAGFASFGEPGNVWRKHGYGNKLKGCGEGLQEGRTGKSYALPTVIRAGAKKSLSKIQIRTNIERFYDCVNANPDLEFFVAYTCDGSKNLNGYTTTEMIELFKGDNPEDIPKNVIFEKRFSENIFQEDNPIFEL